MLPSPPVLPGPDAGTLARWREPGRAGGRRARENAEIAEGILLTLIEPPRTACSPWHRACAQRTLAPRLRAAQVQVRAGEGR